MRLLHEINFVWPLTRKNLHHGLGEEIASAGKRTMCVTMSGAGL